MTPFKYFNCHDAAKEGDLEELKRMHEAGCRWDGRTAFCAVINDHLECFKYALENGCKMDIYLVGFFAVRYNCLDCIKYIIENDFPCKGFIPFTSSTQGNLECFKYCFKLWPSPQDFWNINFELENIIDEIDLDEHLWEKLFDLDLSNNPDMESKVNVNLISLIEK